MTQVAITFPNSGEIIRPQSNDIPCSPVLDRITKTSEAENILRDSTQLKSATTDRDITTDTIG